MSSVHVCAGRAVVKFQHLGWEVSLAGTSDSGPASRSSPFGKPFAGHDDTMGFLSQSSSIPPAAAEPRPKCARWLLGAVGICCRAPA